ncbi:MAG: hypothetical protein JWR69_813 [Pedosphaera sp.]|nr:hypothetical protein [Pedosphaera sp.]
MKSSQTVARQKRVANGAIRSNEKTTYAVESSDEDTGKPESRVWGHWFNTEGMLANNNGSSPEVRRIDM